MKCLEISFSNWFENTEEVWYHGSPTLFDSFRLGKYKRSQQLGFGIHFTQDKEFAKLYGPYIYYCTLAPRKIFDGTKIHSTQDTDVYAFAKELHQRTRPLYVSDNQFFVNLDIKRPNRVEELLKKHGYDAVLYEARYGRSALRGMYVDHKTNSLVMLNPDQITIQHVETIQK